MMETLGEALLWFAGMIGFNAELMARYGPRMLDGLRVTIELVGLSVGIGFVLALPLALARVEGGRITRNGALAFGVFFRGTPLLAQTFLVYYGAGQFRAELESVGLWWLFREAYWCAVITFTLNTMAYQAEIMRGAIQAVPRGQLEAARALGLGPGRIYRHVITPQALLLALRPLGNEVILMIKGSSIASVITVFDLLGTTRLAFTRSFDFEVYLWAAMLYLLLVEIVRRVWGLAERRLTRHLAVRA
jgi:polar amino acid transport system permease protein